LSRMYEKRLRTYRKNGYVLWTGDVQQKQNTNAIYDSGNYTEKFERDVIEANRSIVVSSPGIRADKLTRFMEIVKRRQESGITVTIITTDPDNIAVGDAAVCCELLKAMENGGIEVVTKEEVLECFAVIDDELVWHGGMNLLGKVDAWDNLMRIKSIDIAAELLEMALGEKGKT